MSDEEEDVKACPRRTSEVNVANKIIPIPPASSFFVFAHDSRFLIFFSVFIFHFARVSS